MRDEGRGVDKVLVRIANLSVLVILCAVAIPPADTDRRTASLALVFTPVRLRFDIGAGLAGCVLGREPFTRASDR